jgi:hypothetical protein
MADGPTLKKKLRDVELYIKCNNPNKNIVLIRWHSWNFTYVCRGYLATTALYLKKVKKYY